MGNTRFGNNNVYCQDNEAGWVKWKGSRFSEEIFQFVCQIISLRKRHPILHMKTELKVMDTIGCGYPDISYHGTEAWRPNISYISRMVGILLCGRYAASGDRCFYIALNMHWEAHELALPKLPKGMRWTRLLSTVRDREAPEGERQPSSEEGRILTQARSVCVYCSEPDPLYKEKTKKSRRKTAVKNEGMETF